jgi:hypothetical protein
LRSVTRIKWKESIKFIDDIDSLMHFVAFFMCQFVLSLVHVQVATTFASYFIDTSVETHVHKLSYALVVQFENDLIKFTYQCLHFD